MQLSVKRYALMTAVLFCLAASTTEASTLWYNGDWNFVNGLSNERNTAISDSRVYDNFQVTGPGWTIDSLWSNNVVSATGVTSAYWEIRSGVSEGNGGSLLFSGTSSATLTATGRSGFGFNEYQVLVGGLNIFLTPGTYWLTVAPIGSGSDRSLVTTTSGANGVGTLLGGGAFWDSAFFGENFANAGEGVEDINPDFSMGVSGTVGEGAPVPEPASLTLLGLGLAGMGARRWRQRKA